MHPVDIGSQKEFCNCGSLLKCERIFSHYDYEENGSPYYKIQIFKVLACPACNSPTVLLYSAWGDSYEDAVNESSGNPIFHKFTQRVLYAPKRSLHIAIPESITEVARQAEAVLASSPRASFILCRAVLEEICNYFEIPTEESTRKGGSRFIGLRERLLKLYDEQEMPEDVKVIINGIKDLGDKGAHQDHLTFSRQVKNQEAENLLMLMYYILERVFVDKYRQQEAEEALENLKNKILPTEK